MTASVELPELDRFAKIAELMLTKIDACRLCKQLVHQVRRNDLVGVGDPVDPGNSVQRGTEEVAAALGCGASV